MCRWKIICRCSCLASLQPYTLLGRLWVTNGLWSQQQALLLPQLRCFSWKKQKKAELNVERWSHKGTDFSSLWQKNWINDREAMWSRWPVPIIGPGEAWLTICSLWGTPVTDKLNFKATYMLEDMINEQSLAMICNFVAEYNPLQSFRLISTVHFNRVLNMNMIAFWNLCACMNSYSKCRQARRPNSFELLEEKERIKRITMCQVCVHAYASLMSEKNSDLNLKLNLWVITIEDLQEYDAMNPNPTDLVLFSTAAQSHSRFSFSLTGSLKQVKCALSSFSLYNYVNLYSHRNDMI